jgi:DNA modification methylase
LGRPLSENNSGAMQWGDEYRDFHSPLWAECIRVLKPNGKFVLNIKDHIRNGERQFVTAWHTAKLCELGLEYIEHVMVDVPSLKNGENSESRIPYESILLFQKN